MLPTSMKARVYIAITLLAGLLSLSLGLFHGQWTEPSRYVCYLALALLASGMKVSLPGVHGTMSVILDRKSTRLNSSHTVISYAVFCLKKKNIILQNRIEYT